MRIAATLIAALAAACAPLSEDEAPTPGGTAAEATPGDALAPEAFRFAGEALWDGRPSLGGVWVAHPGVEEPSRALIRRVPAADGGEPVEVTGALFRRDEAGAGPPLQVSSDAAEALGLVAGQPAALEVTALRRVDGPADAEAAAEPGAEAPADGPALDAALVP